MFDVKNCPVLVAELYKDPIYLAMQERARPILNYVQDKSGLGSETFFNTRSASRVFDNLYIRVSISIDQSINNICRVNTRTPTQSPHGRVKARLTILQCSAIYRRSSTGRSSPCRSLRRPLLDISINCSPQR